MDLVKVAKPWGWYSIIQSDFDRFQVKLLAIDPGEQLSVQKHTHRSEHWVVVKGTVQVVIDGEDRVLTEDECVNIPIMSEHTVTNIGKIQAIIVEVQYGSYLGEDDIIRIEDKYGRVEGD